VEILDEREDQVQRPLGRGDNDAVGARIGGEMNVFQNPRFEDPLVLFAYEAERLVLDRHATARGGGSGRGLAADEAAAWRRGGSGNAARGAGEAATRGNRRAGDG